MLNRIEKKWDEDRLKKSDKKNYIITDRTFNLLTDSPEDKLKIHGKFNYQTKWVHVGSINLYQIQIGGISIFHGGDSDYVPIKDYRSDLAFLPTGDPSPTASPQGAFNMASDLNPSVIVAMHGSMGQSKDFEQKIKEKMPHTIVIIPEPYRSKIVTLRKRT
jgi:L-ascorbate metabolism protein UlaG (beta-lactamase superfamily)